MKPFLFALMSLMLASCALTDSTNKSVSPLSAGIRQTFLDNKATFQKCYEDLIKIDVTNRDTLQGKFMMDLDINSDGKVTRFVQDIEKSDIASPELLKCIAAHATQWQFPKPSPPTKVIQVFYPIKYSKQDHP
jgi:hypothetical protein